MKQYKHSLPRLQKRPLFAADLAESTGEHLPSDKNKRERTNKHSMALCSCANPGHHDMSSSSGGRSSVPREPGANGGLKIFARGENGTKGQALGYDILTI